MTYFAQDIVPTGVGVNRWVVSSRDASSNRPHGRGGEP